MVKKKKADARKGKLNAEAKRSERVDFFFNWGPTLGAIVVAFVLGTSIWGQFGAFGSHYTVLSPQNPEQLSSVFFSGEPALILCSETEGATSKEGSLHPSFLGAVERLRQKNNEFKGAVLDCSEPLPSGKSTYERFRLDKSVTPVVFLVQGGDLPYQFSNSLLKKSADKAKQKQDKKRKKKKKNANDDSSDEEDEFERKRGGALASVAYERYRKRFAIHKIRDSKSLHSCMKRKSCGLLVGFGDHVLKNTKVKEVTNALIKEFRTTFWTYLDLSKYAFSLQKSLKHKKGLNVMPTMVVFRSFKNETDNSKVFSASALDSNIKSLYSTSNFIRDFLEKDVKSLKPLSKLPSIKKSKKKTDEYASSPASSSQTSSSQRSKDENVRQKKRKPTAKETKNVIENDEQERRRKMEMEAEEYIPQLVEDDEDEDADVYENEDIEEESLDLDLDVEDEENTF